jgi:type IV secretory pathway VirB10-like protein
MDQHRMQIFVPIVVGVVLFIVGAAGISQWLSSAIPIVDASEPPLEVVEPVKVKPIEKEIAKEAPRSEPEQKDERPGPEVKKPVEPPVKKEAAEPKLTPEQEAELQKKEAELAAYRAANAVRDAVKRDELRRSVLANRAVATGKYRPYFASQKAAAQFEAVFFEAMPDAKKLIEYFDVQTSDGSLVVNLHPEALEEGAAPKKLAAAVLRAWRDSPFTQQWGFSKTIDFRARGLSIATDEGK